MPTYALQLRLDAPADVEIGALGRLRFEAGYYVYTGSAARGLWPRVARHFRREKRLRWHIDYLTRVAGPVEAWCDLGLEDLECVWTAALLDASGAPPPAGGFGSSDCGCASHLSFFSARPDLGRLLAPADVTSRACACPLHHPASHR